MNFLKKVLLVFFIVLTIVVGVVSVVYNYGIKTINVDCVGIDINVFGEVDESEILIINSCYDYLKKYYKSSLPDDTKELEVIEIDEYVKVKVKKKKNKLRWAKKIKKKWKPIS